MLIEQVLEWIVEHILPLGLVIPDSYLSTFRSFLIRLSEYNYILPVDTLFSCSVFTMGFALCCGIVKVVIHK